MKKQTKRSSKFWPVAAVLAVVASGASIFLDTNEDKPKPAPIAKTSPPTAPNPLQPPPVPAGFHTKAPTAGSPYAEYSNRQMREWFNEFLDQHPNQVLAQRLKGYFAQKRAALFFERKAYEGSLKGQNGYALARLALPLDPPVPTMLVDTVVFDRRYFSVQQVFRIIQHEGHHLDMYVSGQLPTKLLEDETPDHLFTKEEVRVQYEDEVMAYTAECQLAHGHSDYYFYNSTHEDYCLGYEREGVPNLRRMVVSVYTEQFPMYQRNRDYLLRVANDPSIR